MTPEFSSRLDPAGLEALALLADRPWALDTYLAGSAALCAYIGHRPVRDLDLMGYNRLTSPQRRDLLQDLLRLDGDIRVETARDGFLYVRFPESRGHTGVRFYYYPYPLIDAEEEVAGMSVASALDLGLMKLGAITSRGSRRDFLDLYLLCRQLPLEHLLERCQEKFGHVRDFALQALKGLADLDHARRDPMPDSFGEVTWVEVEAWVEGDVRDLARRRLGLE